MRSGVRAGDRPLPDGFKWPNKQVPVAFIDVSPPLFSPTSSSSSSSSSTSSFSSSSSTSSSTPAFDQSLDSNQEGEKSDEKLTDLDRVEGKRDDKVDEKREKEELAQNDIDPFIIKQFESSGTSTTDSFFPSSFSSSSSPSSTSSSSSSSSTSSSSSSSSSSTSFSYSNFAEAEVLCGVVQGFLDRGMELDKVCKSGDEPHSSDTN